MTEKLYVVNGGYVGTYVGTLDEAVEWATENNVSLEELYLVAEKIDVKELIREKYGE